MVCDERAHAKLRPNGPLLTLGLFLTGVSTWAFLTGNSGALDGTFLLMGVCVVVLAYFGPRLVGKFKLGLQGIEGELGGLPEALPTKAGVDVIVQAEQDVTNGTVEPAEDFE